MPERDSYRSEVFLHLQAHQTAQTSASILKPPKRMAEVPVNARFLLHSFRIRSAFVCGSLADLALSWPLRYYVGWHPHSDRHGYAQLCRFFSAEVQALMDRTTVKLDRPEDE